MLSTRTVAGVAVAGCICLAGTAPVAGAHDAPPVTVASSPQIESVAYEAQAAASPKLERLVGKKLKVKVKVAYVYSGPGVGMDGKLKRGEAFKVKRVSPSGKIAFGRAFGEVNRDVYIYTKTLRLP